MPPEILTPPEAARTLLAIECPCCGHYTEAALAQLDRAAFLSCQSCGHAVDLAAGEQRAVIDTLVSVDRRLDREWHAAYFDRVS